MLQLVSVPLVNTSTSFDRFCSFDVTLAVPNIIERTPCIPTILHRVRFLCDDVVHAHVNVQTSGSEFDRNSALTLPMYFTVTTNFFRLKMSGFCELNGICIIHEVFAPEVTPSLLSLM